jgi:hypothetical protein
MSLSGVCFMQSAGSVVCGMLCVSPCICGVGQFGTPCACVVCQSAWCDAASLPWVGGVTDCATVALMV